MLTQAIKGATAYNAGDDNRTKETTDKQVLFDREPCFEQIWLRLYLHHVSVPRLAYVPPRENTQELAPAKQHQQNSKR